HSHAESEVAETKAKAAGFLAALDAEDLLSPGRRRRSAPARRTAADLTRRPDVLRLLRDRNVGMADFWLGTPGYRPPAFPGLDGKRLLVVDAEDHFTAMLDHQLRSLGLDVEVCGHRDVPDLDGYHLVLLGPGPGDPRTVEEPRVARLRELARRLL